MLHVNVKRGSTDRASGIAAVMLTLGRRVKILRNSVQSKRTTGDAGINRESDTDCSRDLDYHTVSIRYTVMYDERPTNVFFYWSHEVPIHVFVILFAACKQHK